ncbi:MAG TPA: cyclase family protein [Candidatus Binataceae bacterium]|nr:cyclase family protein [Candidatus Binataceae bacterium]
MKKLRSYDELTEPTGLGMRHSWGEFGENDKLGSINLLTPERVTAAAKLIRTGERISLDLPLNLPDPAMFGRQRYKHEIFALNRNEMDDRLDGFYPQGSTQWDGLGHVRAREHGFWGGVTQNPMDGPNQLGIEHWVQHGIAGRGVLVDVAEWFTAQGRPLDPFQSVMITAEELTNTLSWQKVTVEPGDILCLHTGWVDKYKSLDREGRTKIAENPTSAGLRGDEAMARYLWNLHPGALCCDNPAVETIPGDPQVGSLHRRILPLLGLALGEFFDFEKLAERCHATNRSEFFFVANPLNLPGGIGSPGNAMAIL